MENTIMEYTILFTDGETLKIKGRMQHSDNLLYFYGEDYIIKLIVPHQQVKYLRVNK